MHGTPPWVLWAPTVLRPGNSHVSSQHSFELPVDLHVQVPPRITLSDIPSLQYDK